MLLLIFRNYTMWVIFPFTDLSVHLFHIFLMSVYYRMIYFLCSMFVCLLLIFMIADFSVCSFCHFSGDGLLPQELFICGYPVYSFYSIVAFNCFHNFGAFTAVTSFSDFNDFSVAADLFAMTTFDIFCLLSLIISVIWCFHYVVSWVIYIWLLITYLFLLYPTTVGLRS